MQDIKQNLEKLIKYERDPNFAHYSESLEQTEKLDDLNHATQALTDAVKSIPVTELPAFPEKVKLEIDDPTIQQIAKFFSFIQGKDGKDFKYEDFTPEQLNALKPLKSVDYFTDEEISKIIELATPVKGKDYFTSEEINRIIELVTPIKGRDYFDGVSVDQDKIVREVVSKIPLPKNGEDAKAPEVKEVVKEVIKYFKELKGDKRLSLRMFKEGDDMVGKVALHSNMMRNMPKSLIEGDQRWGGHGDNATTPVAFNYENPLTGTLGTSTVYTFSHAIGQLVLNSQTMIPSVDYNGVGTTTATFLGGFIPQPPSLVNIYLA